MGQIAGKTIVLNNNYCFKFLIIFATDVWRYSDVLFIVIRLLVIDFRRFHVESVRSYPIDYLGKYIQLGKIE